MQHLSHLGMYSRSSRSSFRMRSLQLLLLVSVAALASALYTDKDAVVMIDDEVRALKLLLPPGEERLGE